MEASISYILPLEGVFFVRLFQILEDISSYSLTALQPITLISKRSESPA